MNTRRWEKGVRQTVAGVLSVAAEKWPERICVDLCGDRAYSFAEVEHSANRVAHGLGAIGIGRGQSVCAMLDNSIDMIALMYGTLKIGAIFVPLNIHLKGEFLRHQIAECNAAIIIMESDLVSRLNGIVGELPGSLRVFYRGDVPQGGPDFEFQPVSALWSDDRSPIPLDALPEDVCMLVYTSGTTGASKACMISNNYLCRYVRDIVYIGDVQHDDRMYCPTKLFHFHAIGALLAGTHTGSMAVLDVRFSVSNFWHEVRRTSTTLVNVIGAMIPMIANAEDNEDSKACYGQVRRLLGAPYTPDLAAKWKERFGVQYARNTGYGLTEACFVFTTPPDAMPPPGATGKCAEHVDARIFDDDGQECPAGVPGELVLRPLYPNVMFEGYFNRPAETLKVFRNLWFHTGDIGMLDENGWFYFVDRKKDYLRRRGENISSFEMEAAFLKHPMIAEVAVHAIPSELTEDEVKVTAVLKPGATLSEPELCIWAAERVPHYAIPRYIEFRAELPYNASGRLLKYQLREEGVTEGTWDREGTGLTFARR